jgi:thiamine-monophosphate kinase
MLNEIIENSIISRLASGFRRSPLQENQLHESDAEIVRIHESSSCSIAVTIDSISEEIESGLYDDPYHTGWMLVMVNFSDIAAVGAVPSGILISEILPPDLSSEYISQIQMGINEAVNACGTFVLGGDTNSGSRLILTGCALGSSPDNKFLKRTGCQIGDLLYSTGKAGRGNAYAITKLVSKNNGSIKYLPSARLKEALVIKEYAGCCIDTSDGFISAMDQLMRLNNCGITLIDNWSSLLDEKSICIMKNNNLPEWLLLAGQHGEFELLFTISPEKEADFLSSAHKISWLPLKIGEVTAESDIQMDLYGRNIRLDSKLLRNLPFSAAGNITRYLESLIEYDISLHTESLQKGNSKPTVSL